MKRGKNLIDDDDNLFPELLLSKLLMPQGAETRRRSGMCFT